MSDLYDSYREVNGNSKNDNSYQKELNKNKLKEITKKKFTTTMIGSLDTYQKFFGFLWQDGLDENELTANEKRFKELWQEARNEILNKGNAQLRAALKEIDEYEFFMVKRSYTFRIDNSNVE